MQLLLIGFCLKQWTLKFTCWNWHIKGWYYFEFISDTYPQDISSGQVSSTAPQPWWVVSPGECPEALFVLFCFCFCFFFLQKTTTRWQNSKLATVVTKPTGAIGTVLFLGCQSGRDVPVETPKDLCLLTYSHLPFNLQSVLTSDIQVPWGC